MIAIQQIRAARSLLGLQQADLASKAGISQTSLSAIEREAKAPRSKTLENIQNALEDEGIEFLDGMGLRLKDHIFNIKIFEKDAPASLEYHQDILDTLTKKGGEFLAFSNQDTYEEPKLRRVQYWHFKQMVKFGFTERIVLPESESLFYGPKQTSEYRVLKKDLFGQMETSIYGHKFIINEPSRIVAIENVLIVEAFKRQFEFYWDLAKPIPVNTPRVFDRDVATWG